AGDPRQAADLPGVYRLGLRLPVPRVPGRRERLVAGGAAQVPGGHHRRTGERPARADRAAEGGELRQEADPLQPRPDAAIARRVARPPGRGGSPGLCPPRTNTVASQRWSRLSTARLPLLALLPPARGGTDPLCAGGGREMREARTAAGT